jgi:hypothetical protein
MVKQGIKILNLDIDRLLQMLKEALSDASLTYYPSGS